MSNIIVGSKIKNKTDALKCLKDHDMEITSDAWEENRAQHRDIDRKYRKVYAAGIKDRIPNRCFSFSYAPGQFETIFDKITGESGRDPNKDE